MITQAELKSRLSYEPTTGIFTWVRGGRFNRLAGMVAGYSDPDGYVLIRLAGVLYQSHRLAWLYMTGAWPIGGFVDHRNTIPADNCWKNLRDATKRINQENRRRAGINSKTKLLGASPDGDRFVASIKSHGKKYNLGRYDTPEEAHAAYVVAKRRLHVGCTL